MSNQALKEVIDSLFNRRWDDELSDEEEEKFQNLYDSTVEKYGWEQMFSAIDQYMRGSCLTSDTTINFANLFWNYNCEISRKIPNPYRFLGYLYYRVNSEPWKYDCTETYEGLVYKLLSGKDNYTHNPFTNYDYIPEKDPFLIAEIEKLRKENV
ncbi:hypothetical protein BCR32DRAFT_324677 [Anaeromyces robustus]|uniref:Uncharacterized protein n=1 Tax=Anaeromyces robustus TaxID=1754192 RepID=A0A1Y1XN81_9FUNG|nr:hypothetical protein BCR32DRAFT_324677 [Anaeromyces robustus]|eukprot:ORX86956.1 hypothetical protein BCR32DRAFT_324677 [Anaeromyces robustus]